MGGGGGMACCGGGGKLAVQHDGVQAGAQFWEQGEGQVKVKTGGGAGGGGTGGPGLYFGLSNHFACLGTC